MTNLRSHPLYAATTAFLARAQGKTIQSSDAPTTRRGGAAIAAAAGSGFDGSLGGTDTYGRRCRPFRPCPESAFSTRSPGNTSGGSAASAGGNLGHAAAGSGWFIQPGTVMNDSTNITINLNTTFSDTMMNSELDRYWVLWRGAGATEGATGVQIDGAAAGTPSALLAYTAATFTDATTQAKLPDAPGFVTAGVFARGTWAANKFSGYAISSEGAVYRLWKYTNDVRVSLGTAAVVPTLNDLVAIRCTGTNIEIVINGVSGLLVVDAVYAAGYSGLCINDADWTQRFNNVTIG